MIYNPLLANKYGCWIVDNQCYATKLEALKKATEIKSSVYFYYHDYIWNTFDKSKLGKIPLTTLYKQRAQQLRDKYNYLVLHYSGGADSHNILHTFLTNNIKLDELCVRWPKPLRDGKFYKPNAIDTTAKNAVSEWNYAIKPSLDWLTANKPEIKINIVDYATNLSEKLVTVNNIESTILSMRINRGVFGSLAMWIDPKNEQKFSDNIGHIFGIDKPILILRENTVCMQFMDSVFETSLMPQAKIENRVEGFYWSADFPILAIEQAYQSALIFKQRNDLRSLIEPKNSMTPSDMMKRFEDQGNLFKKILYPDSWNSNTFQVGKPNAVVSDWFFWLFENTELTHFRNNWTQAFNNIVTDIHDSFLIKEKYENLRVPTLKAIRTKLFPILDLN